MITRVLYISIFCLVSLGAQFHSSIQGREYEDRVNGIYDLAITDQQVSDLLESMKQALRDEIAFSSLVSYPCKFNTVQSSTVLNSVSEFRAIEEKILSEKLRSIIDMSSLDNVFVNSQGFMIGDGNIWFIPGKGIISFNA